MTDLLVIRSSLSDPSIQVFGDSSPAAHDDDVERTPPRDETKPKENRPSDPVSRTMKAVQICSPGNPRNQRKLKVRALRWGTQVKHALAGEEIQASSKPGSPVSKPGSPVSMAAVSPRSPRGRESKRWQQRKDVQGGSNMQKAEEEEAYPEENKPLLADESGKQANRATMTASPTRWQQLNEVQSGSNTQEATEAYEEEDKTTDIDPLFPNDHEPGNETDNCLDVNLVMDQSSSPGNLLEETGRWTGENRAKVIASPPTSEVAHFKQIDNPSDKEEDDPKLVIASPPTSEVAHYKQIDNPHDKEEFWDVYDDPEQLNEVQERLALYRIKANELFWEGKELDIAQLKKEYSPDTLRNEGYFEHYELNQEWYFNPEYCKRSALDDYQRLVLHNDLTYIFWESYHTTCTTLKSDQEFLQFYEELWLKVKSIEDDDVERDKKHFAAQRRRYEIKARTEALKIATCFPSIYADLVHIGIMDCLWSAMFDLAYHKDLDHIFFEIWKRVAKEKVGFTDALEDLYKLNLYPLQQESIKAEFEERPLRSIKMKDAYYTHVAHIDENVPEDEVVALIKQAVNKILPKSLIYVDYIRKKLEVAKEIGVIP